MQEYDIYLPLSDGEGAPVADHVIQDIKKRLVKAFGGYTHFPQKSDGAWRVGGVTFHDEVNIVRVLDDGTAKFDLGAFKRELEALLRQESVLIVERTVRLL